MKLAFREIESFVKKPYPDARVVLVYGPDDGLMRERAKTMGMTVVSDYNDPFNVAVLNGDSLAADTARLNDEASAISMMGGDRLIRIEDATDKITDLIKDYLQNPSSSALVILEAGELGPRSKLRALCEKAANAAAIPCYVEDERDLARLVREILQEAGMRIEPDAASLLASNVVGDRMRARSEIEKLVLYVGKTSQAITTEDVQACIGEAGARTMDELIYNTAGNNAHEALRAYNQLMEEGVNFTVILRALLNHFRRLHITKSRIASGETLDMAMKKLMPAIFFKQENAFKSQVSRWSLAALENVMARISSIEAQCKQTGTPVETLCAQAILGISKSAR